MLVVTVGGAVGDGVAGGVAGGDAGSGCAGAAFSPCCMKGLP